jgi:hypothetical protein
MFFNTRKEISDWLKSVDINKYTIFDLDGQLVVDVYSDVNLYNKNLTNIPVKFKAVSGNFDITNNQLTSLKGCPNVVIGHFNCRKNQLTSLEFAPEKINSWFCCDENRIVELKNHLWIKYFQKNFEYLNNNQLLDLDFLNLDFLDNLEYYINRYKKTLKTMTYDLRTLKENREKFKQFLDSGLITAEQVNLDLWSSDVS